MWGWGEAERGMKTESFCSTQSTTARYCGYPHLEGRPHPLPRLTKSKGKIRTAGHNSSREDADFFISPGWTTTRILESTWDRWINPKSEFVCLVPPRTQFMLPIKGRRDSCYGCETADSWPKRSTRSKVNPSVKASLWQKESLSDQPVGWQRCQLPTMERFYMVVLESPTFKRHGMTARANGLAKWVSRTNMGGFVFHRTPSTWHQRAEVTLGCSSSPAAFRGV